MALKLSKGQWAILAMFGAVAVYVGALMLLVEPTIWRDVPVEGMSRNGAAFDESIAEIRFYRMPHRTFPFYFQDELAPVQPAVRVADKATIKRILTIFADARGTAGNSWCERIDRASWLHVVSLRADGSVFGYVILTAARKAADAPAGLPQCGLMITDDPGPGVRFTDIYGVFDALEEITGVRF